MSSAISLLAAVAALAQIATGLSIPHRRDDGGLRVVSLDTARRTPRDPVRRDRLRKRGTFEVGLDNEVGSRVPPIRPSYSPR